MHSTAEASSSSTCWIMCITNNFAASVSIGEISAAAALAIPHRNTHSRQAGTERVPASRRAARQRRT